MFGLYFFGAPAGCAVHSVFVFVHSKEVRILEMSNPKNKKLN